MKRRHDDATDTAEAVIWFIEYVSVWSVSALFAMVVIGEVVRWIQAV
mgnify:CR=1 FL=1